MYFSQYSDYDRGRTWGIGVRFSTWEEIFLLSAAPKLTLAPTEADF